MLRAYASRDSQSSAPGTPMLVAHPATPPPSATAHTYQHYPALDAPAQPAPVDAVPGPQLVGGGRTLYAPGQERRTMASEGSRYSVSEEAYEDAYGGYGRAA